MNNELTFTASTQGVPFRDYHWTIDPRAALETGANAPLARPGGMLGSVFSLSHRLRNLEGNRQRNSIFPRWRKPPPVLTGPLWWLQPLLEVELWPSIGQETKWPTAPPQERAVSPTRYYKQPPNLKSLLFSTTLTIQQEPHQAPADDPFVKGSTHKRL